jgi:hypothetical protein
MNTLEAVEKIKRKKRNLDFRRHFEKILLMAYEIVLSETGHFQKVFS